jgi:hypothetical protein
MERLRRPVGRRPSHSIFAVLAAANAVRLGACSTTCHLVDVGSISTPRPHRGESGLRTSEVIGLREEDLLELSKGRYQVRVLGKADKERLVSCPHLGRVLRR